MSNSLLPYASPEHRADAYNCPYCNTYAEQIWYTGYRMLFGYSNTYEPHEILTLARCRRCGKYQYWINDSMIYPESLPISPPNEDLNEEIKNDYYEAGSIIKKSPRGASALLRLSIEKLCQQLDQSTKNISTIIGNLVKRGMPIEIQQALDIVRVIGNNAVHPGQIDIKDNVETAIRLFELINIIAERMITQPKKIKEFYEKVIPEKAKEAIENRDKNEKD